MGCNRVDIVYNGRIAGTYDPATGNLFAPGDNADEPVIFIIGEPGGDTGQLKVRQPAGNYLRACRWDRIAEGSVLNPKATLRTLPQCGCGGSLGMPQLFETFQEMSEYYFRAFFLKEEMSEPLQCSVERNDDDPRDN